MIDESSINKPFGKSGAPKHQITGAYLSLSSDIEILFKKAIVYILIEQPQREKIGSVLVEYFEQVKDGKTPKPSHSPLNSCQDGKTGRRAIIETISPIICELIKGIIVQKPEKLYDFIIEIIKSLLHPIETFDRGNVKESRKISILVIGLDGSGKSTMISSLSGNKNPRCKKTLGFRPIDLRYGENIISLFDIGGGPEIRGIWKNYYHDVHGAIYVVDSCCEDKKFEESISVLHKILGHRYIQEKPLLVFCNKQDDSNARTMGNMQMNLDLLAHAKGSSKMLGVSFHPQKAANDGEIDPRIDKGLEWLLCLISKDFEKLQQRVVDDTKSEGEKARKLEDQRVRRALEDLIYKACFTKTEESSDDFLSMEDAKRYLRDEIGVDELPKEGLEVVNHVGCHKVALRFVVKLICSKGKRKRKMSWEELETYINDIYSRLEALQEVSQFY